MNSNSQYGMVLITVLVFSAIASTLVTGLYFASSTRTVQGTREIQFDKAFFVAESGIERAKAYLCNGGTNWGVLFGGLTNYGEGQFHVNVSPTFIGSNDYITIRSTGIVSSAKRVLEVIVKIMPSIPCIPSLSDGAICFYGNNSSLFLKNANNHINGYDWDIPNDFECNGADCAGCLTTNDGVPGVFYCDTNFYIAGTGCINGNPPIANHEGTYDEDYWYDLLDKLLPIATTYTDVDDFGTRNAPNVILMPSGTTKLSGNTDACGVIIVPGGANINIAGTFHFEGCIIIIGDGIVDTAPELGYTGTCNIFGSVICLGGALNIEATGNANIKYSSSALENLSKLATNETKHKIHIISWQEIKTYIRF